MGCDIHCYVEYRPRTTERDYDREWRDFGNRINPGRHYPIFARLAGVRGVGSLLPVRGIPEDLGYSARGDWWLYISDSGADYEGTTTRERAERYHANGARYRNGDNGQPRWVENPDWHTPSWCSPDEWSSVLAVEDDWGRPLEYRALLAAMRQLEADGQEVRVVFWFDN